jgi:hypothetical protein
LKTKFHPQNQSPRATCSTLVAKFSIGFSHYTSISSAMVLGSGLGFSITSVSLSIASKVLKTMQGDINHGYFCNHSNPRYG